MSMAVASTASLLIAVRLESWKSNGGLPAHPRRTNHAHLEMLPKGEWPKWCRTCGGSGLSYCSRCLGTGEYRYIMGFHFMKRDADHT
ncbi:hypothetical protein CRYUN_Cryun05aG0139300 [Craigia yunnanensis]